MDTIDQIGRSESKGFIDTIPSGNSFLVVGKPNPLSSEVICTVGQAGQTILELVNGLDLGYLEVRVAGYVVPQELWGRVKPKAGVRVEVFSFPKGNTGKKILALIVVIAVVYFTGPQGLKMLSGIPGLAVGSTALGFVAAGIQFVGSLIINALVKPSVPKPAAAAKEMNTFTGSSNAYAPYSAVPCVIGEHRFFPALGAMPYTEISGFDQYLRMLLDLGYGNLDISDIKIDDDPLTNYTDVEYQFAVNPTLFTNDVFELGISLPLDNQGDTITRTSVMGVDELGVDIIFPSGLFGTNGDGDNKTITVDFTVQYRAVGSGTWLNATAASGWTVAGTKATTSGSYLRVQNKKNRDPIRTGVRWKVSNGQYEVKVTNSVVNFGGAKEGNTMKSCVLGTLRSIKYSSPSLLTTNKMALRIKATSQLNGTINRLNMVAYQRIPVWNGVGWAEMNTKNPAWIYHWLLTTCEANSRRVSPERVNLDDIYAWAQECDAKGFCYSGVVDQRTTMNSIMHDICAAGRATFAMKDTKYTVVRDVPQTVPVQMFTPRNSSGFTGQRIFADEIHGLRCQFMNPQANWQMDEMTVYADGYNESNASNFEQMEMRGVTDPDAVWKLARYHLAVAKHRKMTYSWKTDVEHLVCTRGDLVEVAHDVADWGMVWGRIASMSMSGGNMTHCVLDEKFTPTMAGQLAIRIRKEDGTQAISNIVTPNLITNGGLVCTRSGVATYLSQNGVLLEALPNTPRFDYSPTGEFLGIMVERGSINLSTNSEDFSSADWTNEGTALTRTLSDKASISATLDDWILADGSITTQSVLSRTWSVANDALDHVYSIFVKKQPANAPMFALKMALSGGTSVSQTLQLNPNTGDVLGGTSEQVVDYGSHWRIWVKLTNNTSGNTSLKVTLYPAYGSVLGTVNVAMVGANTVFGSQLEKASAMTSYIPTGSTAQARGREDVYMATSAIEGFSATQGTLVCEYRTNMASFQNSTNAVFQLTDALSSSSDANSMSLSVGLYRSTAFTIKKTGTVNASLALGTSLVGEYDRVAVAYETDLLRGSRKGGAVESDEVIDLPAVSFLKLGDWNQNDSFRFNGHIRYLRYLPEARTDLQLIADSVVDTEIEGDWTLKLATPMAGVNLEDLCTIGLAGMMTKSLIVTKIQSGENLTATLTGVEYIPEIYDADAGTPPVFISTITNQPWCKAPPPPKLSISYSNPNVDGSTDYGGSGGDYGGSMGGGGYGGGGIWNPSLTIEIFPPVSEVTTVPV